MEQGEEVIIARHGKEIARLVPVRPIHSRERARAAIRGIRERAEQSKVGAVDWSEWKSYQVAVSLLLDSSAPLAWVFSDETTNPILRLVDAADDEGAIVPSVNCAKP